MNSWQVWYVNGHSTTTSSTSTTNSSLKQSFLRLSMKLCYSVQRKWNVIWSWEKGFSRLSWTGAYSLSFKTDRDRSLIWLKLWPHNLRSGHSLSFIITIVIMILGWGLFMGLAAESCGWIRLHWGVVWQKKVTIFRDFSWNTIIYTFFFKYIPIFWNCWGVKILFQSKKWTTVKEFFCWKGDQCSRLFISLNQTCMTNQAYFAQVSHGDFVNDVL